MDYMKQERERGITIQSAAITFQWLKHRVNLIDTPGHVDFTMEVERSIRVLDGAVAILDGVAGVEAQTETVWRQADRYGLPRIAFVNKLDRAGADFKGTVAQLKSKLGVDPLVCQIPFEMNDPSQGIVDLVTLELLKFGEKGEFTRHQLKENKGKQERESLVEALADLDDQLMDKYLEVSDPLAVPAQDLREALRRVTLSCKGVPVFCGASLKGIGVQPLLDAVIHYLPSPLDRPLPTTDNNKSIPLDSKHEHMFALAFKVIYSPKRGALTFVRVYSGTLNNRVTLTNHHAKAIERPTRLLQMYADEYEEIPQIEAGNIGIVIGLKATKTGDTLYQGSTKDKHMSSLQLPRLPLPAPVFTCSVEPTTNADEAALQEALANLMLEDPSLRVHKDADSGQTLLSGMGELHLEIVQDRLVHDLNIQAEFGKVFISYRETFNAAPSPYKHTFHGDVLGKPTTASMKIDIRPLDPTSIMHEENQVNINVSAELIRGDLDVKKIQQAVKEGLEAAISRGGAFGFPLARLNITIENIELPLDQDQTNPSVILGSLSQCAYQSLAQHPTILNNTLLLEPIMNVTVTTTQASQIGTILSDLTGTRQANIISLDQDESSSSQTRSINALVPLSSLLGYASKLRSLTAGSATFSMLPSGYAIVAPNHIPKSILENKRLS